MQTRVVKPLIRLIISDANKKLKQSHLFKPYLLYGLSDFRYEWTTAQLSSTKVAFCFSH